MHIYFRSQNPAESFLRKPAARLGEVVFCERSELRGSGGQRAPSWPILGHLGGRGGAPEEIFPGYVP